MHWFILFVLLIFFVPFLHLGLVFLVIFVLINVLLLFGEIIFRSVLRKRSPSPFSPHSRRPASPTSGSKSPRSSFLKKDDDVEDAEFREEK